MKTDENRSKTEQKLQNRISEHRLRRLQPVQYHGDKKKIGINGSSFLNFCSNDYLGLSMHPEVTARSIAYTEQYGTSSSSSRLVSGSLTIHHELEEKIASIYGAEACLLFGNGFQANVTLLAALAERGDMILADKRSHNSIIQGGVLSRADFRRFQHNDCDHLEKLLKSYRQRSTGECRVITESLFSMDGDRAPLDDISALCTQYGASLMVDDAHAFGVWGLRGLGYAAGRKDIDLHLGTLGKAGGGYGAFAVCSRRWKEYLVNFCAGVIYTTSPAPGATGAADAAFDLIPGMDKQRSELRRSIVKLTDGLKESRFQTGDSTSQIIPVLLPDEEKAVELARHLYKNGIFVQAIRPPTVHQSRLRLTVSSFHSEKDIQALLEALENG